MSRANVRDQRQSPGRDDVRQDVHLPRMVHPHFKHRVAVLARGSAEAGDRQPDLRS